MGRLSHRSGKGGEIGAVVFAEASDFTKKFARVAEDVAELKTESAVIDGEVVALDEKGRPLFQRGCFVLESKQFQAAKAKESGVEKSARQLAMKSGKASANGDHVLNRKYLRSDPADNFLIPTCIGGQNLSVAGQAPKFCRFFFMWLVACIAEAFSASVQYSVGSAWVICGTSGAKFAVTGEFEPRRHRDP
jgi:hypothetical protein